MSIFEELETQYFEIDKEYGRKEFSSHTKGHFQKERMWRRKRDLHTHAYFLFAFTRLEELIKANSSKLINTKVSRIRHWKTRAIWEIADPANLHFKRRTTLLAEKGHADFNTILDYYDKRNTIAHGGTIPTISSALNMIGVFSDMKRLVRILKR